MDQKFDLQNSIKEKNNNNSIFAKCKNQNLKEFITKNYKAYRNLLSTLHKWANKKYFTNFSMKTLYCLIKVALTLRQLNLIH